MMLADYKTYYLNIRDTIDKYPSKIFIPFTPPPLPHCATDPLTAGRARNFADWMKSSVYTAGHPNIFVFDFFYYLAEQDPNSPYYNMGKAIYYPTTYCDNHPNALAAQTIAPILADFVDTAIRSYP